MRTFGVNRDNDLFISGSGLLALSVDIQAVAEGAKQAMQAQLGEMLYAADRGIPTLATVWDRYNPVQFEAAARQTLLLVPNVTGVPVFTARREGDVLRYEATIQTLFGDVSVTNG